MNVKGFDLTSSRDALEYEFDNVGPSGTFPMAINYLPSVQYPGFTNLGFGQRVTVERNGLLFDEIDDEAVLNNRNVKEIMATVIASLLNYWNHYPEELVTFGGSTVERSRLYGRILRDHGHLLDGIVEVRAIRNYSQTQVPFDPKLWHDYKQFFLIPK